MFHLNNNAFTGQLRDSFDFLPNLTLFDVGNNEFTGFLPSKLFDLSTLEFAYFSNNSFVGTIPANLENANSLRDLFLDGNLLRGGIPDISEGQLPNLTEFLLQDNNIDGVMPNSICLLRNAGTLGKLWADCGPPNPPEVICKVPGCCTRCFPSDSVRTDSPTHSPTNSPTIGHVSIRPSQSPSFYQSANRTQCSDGSRSANLIGRLSLLTNASVLLNATIPQGEAFRWLDEVDLGTDVCAYSTLEQRYSLAVLYYSTRGSSWMEQAGWITADPECSWFNITCNAASDVVAIKLRELNRRGVHFGFSHSPLTKVSLFADTNGLNGTLQTELSTLTQLEELSLKGNHLQGDVIPELAQLKFLRLLDLEDNALSGNPWPEITKTTSLTSLRISQNYFSGQLPTEIDHLNHLVELRIASNKFQGPIPTQLGNMALLETIVLNSNNFTGSLPVELGGLNAIELHVHDNNLTGPIPTSLFTNIHLVSLKLSDNKLTGYLDGTISGLVNLRELDVQNNQLSGELPFTIHGLSKLGEFVSPRCCSLPPPIGTHAPSLLALLSPTFPNPHRDLTIESQFVCWSAS